MIVDRNILGNTGHLWKSGIYTKVFRLVISTFILYSKMKYHITWCPRIKFNDRSLHVWTVGLDIQRDQWQYCFLVAEIGVTAFPFSCNQRSHDPDETTTTSQLQDCGSSKDGRSMWILLGSQPMSQDNAWLQQNRRKQAPRNWSSIDAMIKNDHGTHARSNDCPFWRFPKMGPGPNPT